MLTRVFRPHVLVPVSALLCLVVLQFFLLDIRAVSGPSMAPTLAEGRLVGIFRQAYGLSLPFADSYLVHWHNPDRGDIVVFFDRQTGHYLVKRCLGVPGDRLELAGGELRVGNQTFSLTPGQKVVWQNRNDIPAGQYFLVGDNTGHSRDSRELGLIAVEDIKGKMVF